VTPRAFPRPLQAVHQIEITSRCNLACVYCPSRDIAAGRYPGRAALDMTRAVFERSLAWVAYCVRVHGQAELNLAGIGESTLHPEFVEFVTLARRTVGPHAILIFATNGLPPKGVDLETLVRGLAPARPRVWVSLHRPERAARAVELYRRYGLLAGVSTDPATGGNDWAGQVDWPVTGSPLRCQWLRDGKVMVMADGRITTCCLDAQGCGVVGHVDDPIGALDLRPYALCQGCYQVIGVPTWDQRRGRALEAVPA
jgi:hypothetical protein